MKRLNDRTIIMSGGSRGIGLAIAVAAAREGANIVLLAKTDKPDPRLPGTIHTAAAQIEAAGGRALAVVGDVRIEESVQRAVAEVMASVPTTDTRLVDLYANLGNADPLIVACALEGQERDSQYLIAPAWIVVTGDEAVRAKATEFELKVLSKDQFAAIIDKSVPAR